MNKNISNVPQFPFIRYLWPALFVLYNFFLIGCASSIKQNGYDNADYTGETEECEVIIQKEKKIKEEKGIIIGNMKVGDTGFSINCSEENVLDKLKAEACRLGADVLILRDIKQPDFLSSCYRVTADFVKLHDLEDIGKISSDSSYNENAVQNRVKKSNETQTLLRILGGIAGFILGLMLTSGI